MAKKTKQIARICKNCKLFDSQNNECAIVILHEGERCRLPVEPNDKCFFEGEYFDPTTKAVEDFAGDIQQVRFWVEDEKGEKTNGSGVVKMEYPAGFFSPDVQKLLDLDNAKSTP